MMYLIAGGLLGAAVAILTLPWSRRDAADLSHIELGYASQGPRGAVAGALRVLRAEGVVRYSRQDGVTRTRKALPDDLDPLARAIHAGLGIPQHPSSLRGLPGVEDELSPVAERVRAAGLRVGRARRAIGLLAALAAPVTSVVALVQGVGKRRHGTCGHRCHGAGGVLACRHAWHHDPRLPHLGRGTPTSWHAPRGR